MTLLSYRRHRFPPEIIQHAIWLYLRFTLSYRDVEELLAERGVEISYETVRRWVLKFGPVIARRLRRCRPRPSNLRTFIEATRFRKGKMSGALLPYRGRSFTGRNAPASPDAPALKFESVPPGGESLANSRSPLECLHQVSARISRTGSLKG